MIQKILSNEAVFAYTPKKNLLWHWFVQTSLKYSVEDFGKFVKTSRVDKVQRLFKYFWHYGKLRKNARVLQTFSLKTWGVQILNFLLYYWVVIVD